MLAFGTQVRRFKPGRSRRIFQGEKILSTPSFGRKVKPFVPCRRFTACKRSLNVTWKSGIFRQNSIGHFSPKLFLLSLLGSLVETPGDASRTTKDQGLYNKPSAAGHPGALGAGTLPQYKINTFDLHLILPSHLLFSDFPTIVLPLHATYSTQLTRLYFIP